MNLIKKIRSINLELPQALQILAIANSLSALSWALQGRFPLAVMSGTLAGLLIIDQYGDYWPWVWWRNITGAILRVTLVTDLFWICISLAPIKANYRLQLTSLVLGAAIGWSIVHQFHEHKRLGALEERLLHEVAEWKISHLDFLDLVPKGNNNFEEVLRQARVLAYEKREAMINAWLEIKLPTRRKLNLIYADIAPEQALSPEVIILSDRELAIMRELSRPELVS